MADIKKAAFQLGDIVVLKSFPEPLDKVKKSESILLEESPSLIPPFMVIGKVFCNQDVKNGHNSSTGFPREKTYFYQCHWYDAVNGVFRTKRFYQPLIERLGKTFKIDAINKIQAGAKVILSTSKVEKLKKFASDNIYASSRDLVKFLPPIMLVTDISEQSITEITENDVQSIRSKNTIKCIWYNAAKGKYESDDFPLDVLELVR